MLIAHEHSRWTIASACHTPCYTVLDPLTAKQNYKMLQCSSCLWQKLHRCSTGQSYINRHQQEVQAKMALCVHCLQPSLSLDTCCASSFSEGLCMHLLLLPHCRDPGLRCSLQWLTQQGVNISEPVSRTLHSEVMTHITWPVTLAWQTTLSLLVSAAFMPVVYDAFQNITGL